jgi:hypothetical protein
MVKFDPFHMAVNERPADAILTNYSYERQEEYCEIKHKRQRRRQDAPNER